MNYIQRQTDKQLGLITYWVILIGNFFAIFFLTRIEYRQSPQPSVLVTN